MSRDIPALIKRTIRQECHFGCVFCGSAVYQYEHIEPFHTVRDHVPKDMTLLCGTHHDQVTRGQIEKTTVRARRSDPYRLSHRWPSSDFYPNTDCFPVILGGVLFIHPRTAVRVFGRDLLSIREPEGEDAPIRLSAEFYDDDGRLCLCIDDNELRLNPYSWDIEARGTKITIRRALRDVALRIRLCPERLIVESMRMRYRGVQLVANEREFKVVASARQSYRLTGSVMSPDTGIEINKRNPRTNIEAVEPPRTINLLGSGGDYTIAGRQPPNTKINFLGSARSLTVNFDGAVNVGGPPPTPELRFALSQRAAMSLALDDLEILIGAGCRAHSVSVA